MRNILIYRPIGNDEKIHFLAEDFVREFSWAENDSDVTKLLVRFNSPGGDVYAGLAMISKMTGSKLIADGLVDGLAASMTAFIALSCNRLTMHAHAKMMLHLPQVGITGDAEKLRATADTLDTFRNQFATIIANKAGITTEKAIELYLQPGTDVWLTAQEALAASLCDEIVGEVSTAIPATATAGELHKIYAELIDTTNNNKMDKVQFMAVLGSHVGTLTAQSADTEFLAVVTAIVADNTQLLSDKSDLTAQVKVFNDAKIAADKAEITALLDTAIEAKKITAVQREAWAGMFSKDFDNAKAMLNGLTPVKNIADVPGPGEDEKATAELAAAYTAADKAGTLEAIKAYKPEAFKKMFVAKFGKEPNK